MRKKTPNPDGLVKSRKSPFFVIPAKVLRQAQDREPAEWPESSLFIQLRRVWTPVFTGVTTFYETVNPYLSDSEMVNICSGGRNLPH